MCSEGEERGIRWGTGVRFKEGGEKLSTFAERLGVAPLPWGHGSRPVRESLFWRQSPTVSSIAAYLLSRVTDDFFPGLAFQGCLHVTLEDRESTSQQRADLFPDQDNRDSLPVEVKF